MQSFVAQSSIPRLWQAVTNLVIATVKDPLSDENFTIDWSVAIGTDTISASTWIMPPGLTASREIITNNSTATQAGIAGGLLGTTYFVANTVVLKTSGQTLVQNLEVTIQSV